MLEKKNKKKMAHTMLTRLKVQEDLNVTGIIQEHLNVIRRYPFYAHFSCLQNVPIYNNVEICFISSDFEILLLYLGYENV